MTRWDDAAAAISRRKLGYYRRNMLIRRKLTEVERKQEYERELTPAVVAASREWPGQEFTLHNSMNHHNKGGIAFKI